jgi:hypothetical protein
MPTREFSEDRGKLHWAERQWGRYAQEPAQIAYGGDRFLRSPEFGNDPCGMFTKGRTSFCQRSPMRGS